MEQPINILIVDDEPNNLAVLAAILDDPGYRLVRAETAEKALLALVAEEFALLVLDIRMPGMTGLELAQAVKERKKTAEVPIIFLSAYDNEDQHVLAGYGSGAVDYLEKPVNAAILRSKVAVFAELHRTHRENAAANHALRAEVTERRRAEQQLRELTETLEQRVTERTQALKASLREKEVLLCEVHHRVKNNLQIVSSLINLQCRQLTDPTMLKVFASTRDRVRAMASVHEQLYHSGNFATVDLAVQLANLARMLLHVHGVTVQPVLQLEAVMVGLNAAVPLSLIANELITNALKYAFVGGRTGTLALGLRTTGAHHELRIADAGPGFPAGLDPATTRTLGLRLVRDLARQIHGELEIDKAAVGATITVRWPARLVVDEAPAPLTATGSQKL